MIKYFSAQQTFFSDKNAVYLPIQYGGTSNIWLLNT